MSLSSIEKLYATYLKTWGDNSVVGFNASESQGLFFLEREMRHCAVGKFVLMKKDASGILLISGQMVRRISKLVEIPIALINARRGLSVMACSHQ